MLGVSVGDLWQVIVIGSLTCLVLVVKRRDFTLLAFDPTHAHAIGINVRLLRALLLGLLALTVVITLQAVGIILVVAMLIIPGTTAYLLTGSMGRMLLLAVIATSVASLAGVYVSFYADLSTGGAVVLAQAVLFLLAYLFGPRGGVLPRRARRLRADRVDRDAAVPVPIDQTAGAAAQNPGAS